MACTHYSFTGTLILNNITPVIQALFGDKHLDATFPVERQVYLAQHEEDSSTLWRTVHENLSALACQLDPSLTLHETSDFKACLQRLASHFGAEATDALRDLTEHVDLDEDADLETLFELACRFDDGHGLEAIQVEGVRRCSKPRLFESGGHGAFLSREVQLYSGSSNAVFVGSGLHTDLTAGLLDDALDRVSFQVNRLLMGVMRDATRQWLGHHLARRLLAKFPSV